MKIKILGLAEASVGGFLESTFSGYDRKLWKSSNEIEVNAFRQILIWPLALHVDSIDDEQSGKRVSAAMKQVVASFRSDPDWTQIADLADHAPPLHPLNTTDGFASAVEKAQRYAEFVYFHDFIQANFYAKPVGPGEKQIPSMGPVTLFSRSSPCRLDAQIKVGDNDRNFSGSIERSDIYLYSTGAALLVVELAFNPLSVTSHTNDKIAQDDNAPQRLMMLADVLDFSDHFRRAYPPFFMPDKDLSEKLLAARVPLDVKITDGATGKQVYAAGAEDLKVYDLNAVADYVDKKRVPPVFGHWRKLISPLRIYEQTASVEKDKTKVYFRQIVDERIPTMSFVSLTGPGEVTAKEAQTKVLSVSRGDWMRLCYVDESGKDETPYSALFMDDFERDCCYDRYFPHPSSTDSTSRMLFSGYHFAMVGAGDYFDHVMVHHFRRHYFQLGLAVHMEVASLLAASSRATHAVRELNKGGDEPKPTWWRRLLSMPGSGRPTAKDAFEDTMRRIERDFLEFTHLFHVTGVSNQVQPTEMLEKWQAHLRVRELYETVRSEIAAANQFVFAVEQTDQGSAASRLNIIATIGLVLGLVFSILGMNVLFGDTSFENISNPRHWQVFGGVLALFSGFGLLCVKLLNTRKSVSSHNLLAVLLAIGCGLVVISFILTTFLATLGAWVKFPG